MGTSAGSSCPAVPLSQRASSSAAAPNRDADRTPEVVRDHNSRKQGLRRRNRKWENAIGGIQDNACGGVLASSGGVQSLLPSPGRG